MKKVFADAVYWVAIANRKDQWHHRALEVNLTHDVHFTQEGFAVLL